MTEKKSVSIITICLNARALVERTIRSVEEQTYKNIQYIVIDGGSTDGTVDIVKKHREHVDYWSSEPDKGISDAFNKGILQAKGDIVGILNAGDWYSPETVQAVVDYFHKHPVNIVHGDLALWEDDELVRVIPGREKGLKRRMTIRHPAMFVHRSAYEKIGLYREDYKIAMDYEWILRAKTHGLRFGHLSKTLTHMLAGGSSSQSWARNRWEALQAKRLHRPGVVNYLYFGWQIFSAVCRRYLLEKIGLRPFSRWLQRKLSL